MEIRTKLKNYAVRKWGDICRHTHYALLGIPFAFAIGALVLGVASVIHINQVLDGQAFQYAAEQYEASSSNYRQLTVLSSSLRQDDGSAPRATSEGLSAQKVQQLHESLELIERSNTGGMGARQNNFGSSNETAIWKDCYSSTAFYPAIGSINGTETGSLERCEIVGVSGDYATIHPFRYESGGFLSPEGGDRYAIILNTQMAWNLFHSFQVTGASVTINGSVYQVCGVVCEGDDAIAETTGVTDARAYICFEQLANLANGSSVPSNSFDQENAVTVDSLAVMSYEVLLQDPIDNIAYNDLVAAMGEVLGYSEGSKDIQIINNTGRFGAWKLWKKYFPLKNAYAGYDGMSVPFYERSARLAEQYIVFWAEVLVASIVVLIVAGCHIYVTFHGRNTKHAQQDEEDEDEIIPQIQRV